MISAGFCTRPAPTGRPSPNSYERVATDPNNRMSNFAGAGEGASVSHTLAQGKGAADVRAAWRAMRFFEEDTFPLLRRSACNEVARSFRASVNLPLALMWG